MTRARTQLWLGVLPGEQIVIPAEPDIRLDVELFPHVNFRLVDPFAAGIDHQSPIGPDYLRGEIGKRMATDVEKIAEHQCKPMRHMALLKPIIAREVNYPDRIVIVNCEPLDATVETNATYADSGAITHFTHDITHSFAFAVKQKAGGDSMNANSPNSYKRTEGTT